MTYPPPLYHGDEGEISAHYRPDGTAPELVYPNGTRVHYLSTGASTGGLFEGLVAVAQMTEEQRAAFYLEHDNVWLP